MSHWWDIHVLIPCRQPGSPFHFIQKIEGTTLLPLPQGMTSFGSSAGSSRDAPSGVPRQDRRKDNKRQKNNHVWAAPAQGAGAPWNASENKGGKGHKGGGGKGHGGGGKGGKYQHKGAGKSSKK